MTRLEKVKREIKYPSNFRNVYRMLIHILYSEQVCILHFFFKLCMIQLRHVSQENVAFTSLEYAVRRYAFIMSSLYKFNDSAQLVALFVLVLEHY